VREAAAWSGVETTIVCPDGPGVLVTLEGAEPVGWGDSAELGPV
jgi:hypothetical protein